MSANAAFTVTALDRLRSRTGSNKALLLLLEAREPTAQKYAADLTVTGLSAPSVNSYLITRAAGSFLADGLVVGSRLTGGVLTGNLVEAGTVVARIVSATQIQADRPVKAAFSGQSATFVSGRQIRLASQAYRSPDGFYWQPSIIRCAGLKCGGGLLARGPDPVSTTVKISRAKFAYHLDPAADATDSLAQYRFEGSRAVLYLADLSVTAMADIPPMLWGMVDHHDNEPDGITLYINQDHGWQAQIPTRTASKDRYKNVPEATAGAPIGVALGDHRPAAMRDPWPDNFLEKDWHEAVGGYGPLLPALVVDSGVGTAPLQVALCSHERFSDIVGAFSLGEEGILIETGDAPAKLEKSGLVDHGGNTTPDTEQSYVGIPDDRLIAYMPVSPTDVRALGSPLKPNTALNPRNAIDVRNETTYAEMNPATAARELVLVMPDLASQGTVLSAEYVIGYSSTLVGGTGRLYKYNQTGGGFSPIITLPSTGGVPAIVAAAVPANQTAYDWAWGGGSAAVDLVADVGATATSGQLRVFFMGYRVKFRIQQNVITPSKLGPKDQLITSTPIVIQPSGPRDPIVIGDYAPVFWYRWLPGVFDVAGTFWWCGRGPKDDSLGSWTGNIGSLITRAPDQLRWLLNRFAGLNPTTDLVYGAGEFGSFADARLDLKTRAGSEFDLSVFIGQQLDLGVILRRFGELTGSWIYLDRFTNRFHWRTWRRHPDRTYDRVLQRDDIEAFSAVRTSNTEVIHTSRVQYGMDYRSGQHLWEAVVSPEASDMGYVPNTANDQLLRTVAGESDRLDFTYLGTSLSAQFDGGIELEAPEMSREVAYKMRFAAAGAPANAAIWCGWPYAFVAWHTDMLDVVLGGVTYAVPLRAGRYSADGSVQEMQRALRATTGNQAWTVTFSRSTGGVSFACGGASFTFLTLTGANRLRNPLFLYGASMTADTTGPTQSYTPGFIDERFTIVMAGASCALQLASGVSAARSIHNLLGWKKELTSQSGNRWTASNIRGDRQTLGSRAKDKFKAKQSATVSGDWLRVTEVAADLRDRVFDFLGRPRVEVTLATHVCPDIRRGDVVEFDADVKAFTKFPEPGSDGSWSGRRFWVTEVMQHLGPSFHQELVLVEA